MPDDPLWTVFIAAAGAVIGLFLLRVVIASGVAMGVRRANAKVLRPTGELMGNRTREQCPHCATSLYVRVHASALVCDDCHGHIRVRR